MDHKATILKDPNHKPPKHLNPANIPDNLKSVNRWLGWIWKWDAKKSKWNKPPVNARRGGSGSSTNPATWCSFDEAIAAVKAGRCDGIGFALGDADGIHFAGIDLDDCRRDDELSDVARDIIATLDTYCEVSPTGTGVKMLCTGQLPPKARTKNKAGTVEIYGSGRYFTLTGERIDGASECVEERQEKLTAVWDRYIGSERETKSTGNGIDQRALAAMLKHEPAEGENDGSKRVSTASCRHDL